MARLIAEYKRYSPWTGNVQTEPLPCVIERYNGMAQAISVLISPEWHGSLEDLETARSLTDLPLLAKGILDKGDITQAAALAADWVLLIEGRNSHLTIFAQESGLQVLLEIHEADQIDSAMAKGPDALVVNSRNLDSGKLYPKRHIELLPFLPDITTVAASGLTTKYPPGYDWVLIGSAFAGD